MVDGRLGTRLMLGHIQLQCSDGFDCRSQCRFTLSNTHHQRRHKLKFHSCLIRQAQRAGGLADVKLSL